MRKLVNKFSPHPNNEGGPAPENKHREPVNHPPNEDERRFTAHEDLSDEEMFEEDYLGVHLRRSPMKRRLKNFRQAISGVIARSRLLSKLRGISRRGKVIASVVIVAGAAGATYFVMRSGRKRMM